MLIENPRGNYSFLKGIGPYSAGAVSSPGFEIEHAQFHRALPLRDGFAAIEKHLKAIGRPKQALCSIELRSPRPFTFQGFSDFNAGYIGILKGWDLFQDGMNPVARTNIAPEAHPPAEPSVYGFGYTAPSKRGTPTFIVAGSGELPEGSLDPHEIVRAGETSTEAIAEKARFVLGLMDGRLKGLKVDWPQVMVTEVYTIHDIHPLLGKEMLSRTSTGILWHYSRPPIVGIEFEMDVRGCRSEVVLG